ncbi:MAG: aspartyl protease family protein [Acidobacteriota bacterium]
MKYSVRFLTLLILLLAIPAETRILAQSRGTGSKRAEKEIRRGNFEEAEKVFRELLEKDQGDNRARLGLSFTLLKRAHLQTAYEEAARVMSLEPLNGRAHSLMGTAMLRSGEFRESIESFYTALKFDPKEALAWAGLSEIAYFENYTKNAYDGLKRAIELEPNEPDYYVSLARTCSRLELYNEAADAYQRFLEVAPKTDAERRARIRGLIDFYRYLGTTRIHRAGGQLISSTSFELLQNRPFVKVMINGKGPFRFVIDTGASLSVLSDSAAQKLGIKPVARGGMARAVGGSGSFPIIYGLLDSLEIGGTRIETVPVYIRTVHSAPEVPENARADGYVGLSVLSSFEISIDYMNKTVKLDRTPIRAEEALAEGRGPVGLERVTPRGNAVAIAPIAGRTGAEIDIALRSTSGGLASAETHLPGLKRPLNFILDTGATVTVVSKAAVKRFELDPLKLKGETYRVIGAAGIEDGAEALQLETLTVSGLRKSNSRALILDLEPVNETSGFEQHGIIGGDYLAHFLVQFDLRRFRLRLTPQSEAISIAADK